MGTDRTLYGSEDSHGQSDPYVARTHGQVDARLREALAHPGRVVLVVGPSKAGKTRTAFEAVQAVWPDAALVRPAPGQLVTLVNHPRVAESRAPLVVWLDDIQRFLFGPGALTPGLLTTLWTRQADTVVVGTLRSEERARLADSGDLNPTAGQILTDATEVLLAPTSDDAAETRAAREAYPGLDLSEYGLAEQLAGAPILWQHYHDAQYASPAFRAVVETAVDWARVGLYRPIPGQELRDLARARLDRTHRALDITDDALASAEQEARTPPRDVQGKPTGKVAFLQVAEKTEQGRTYQPYPYLVAADDGQRGTPATSRPGSGTKPCTAPTRPTPARSESRPTTAANGTPPWKP